MILLVTRSNGHSSFVASSNNGYKSCAMCDWIVGNNVLQNEEKSVVMINKYIR